ncbi:hypothetical protein ACFL25_01000 [Patescibacteria group bacterium]
MEVVSCTAPEAFTLEALTLRSILEFAEVTLTSTVTPPVSQSALLGSPALVHAYEVSVADNAIDGVIVLAVSVDRVSCLLKSAPPARSEFEFDK